MQVDYSPSGVELVTDVQASIKSGNKKRSRCSSDTSDDDVKIQQLKKQRTGKQLEVSSDEEDSGIDSKKIPLCGGPEHSGIGKFSCSSDQGDSGAEGHTDGSESDGQSAKNKRKTPVPKASRERGKGRKSTKGQWSRRQRHRSRSESEETTEGQQSDLEEIREHRKATKGQRTESENDSEQELSNYELQEKKGFGKEWKRTDTAGKGKTRKMEEQRREKEDESGEETELCKVGKILGRGGVDWSESEEEEKGSGGGHRKKAQTRPRQRTLKAPEGSETEDESGSDSEDKKPSMQKKMTNRKGVSVEGLGRNSDNTGGKGQVKKERNKAVRRRASEEKWSCQSETNLEDKEFKQGRMKKTQKGNLTKKELEEKKQGTHKLKRRRMSSEESETETEEHKGLKQKGKKSRKPSSSEGESQSEAEGMEKGGRKSSARSEDGSEECDSRNRGKKRALKKKSKDVSESGSSQEEEKLKKKGGGKSWGKNVSEMELEMDSEGSGSEQVGRNKSEGLQKTGTQKPRRKSKSKEESGNESVKGEECSSSGDEDHPSSSKQQHQGKDKEHHSGKNEEHPSIRRLKRYIRECGVHRNYKKLLVGCRSRKAQVEVLKQELENLGLKGTPSLAKCKALKQKREEAAEVASLDLSNIITTEGRPRRRNVWSLYSKPEEPPSSPEKSPIHRPIRDWSRLRGVISSDGDSN
ncbi:HIRA-interacting protein 3 isoform X2 [Rhineura floridana]|nr:HIRA-interacting protein 3 isoform X2 [Rhineura floridana]